MELTKNLEGFYRATKQNKRKEFLDAALAEGSSAELELIQKLWDFRYGETAENGMLIDRFVRAWMNLGFASKGMDSKFGKGRRKKELQELLKELGQDFGVEQGELGREILFSEYENLARLIIELDLNDRNFTCIVIGIGRMKDEDIHEKIKIEVQKNTRLLPEAMGMTEEFSEIARAFSIVVSEVL